MARRKDFQIEGALALVTGAGSGIGRETSLALAGHGSRVLAVDIDGDSAKETASACSEKGPEARGLVCDVSDAAAMSWTSSSTTPEWA
jgi:2,3-dihydro-2,3-dihydroxybenzoate dehydrogenase